MAAVPTLREILARLVAFDTTSRRSNLALIEWVEDLLDRPGIRFDRVASEDGRKANLLVTLGPETGDRQGLLLSGHVDVVPADEPGWESDPFELVEDDGHLVGRGACDMKGFVALTLRAAATLDPHRLARPLALLLTYDEEVGCLGAKRFVEAWDAPERLPRRAIVGEPTGLAVVRMHKGHLRARLVVHGEPAHSGLPHLGENAIEPAARAIVALSELREALEADRPPHAEAFPEVPYVPLNVATVEGGVADNVIPDRCEVTIGARPLPGMEASEIFDRIRAAIAPVLRDEAWSLDLVNETPSLLTAGARDVVRLLADDVGQDGDPTVSFATDGGWLSTLGIDCVVCGPGSIEVAHRPNEWIDAGALDGGGDLLERAIRRWCLEPDAA